MSVDSGTTLIQQLRRMFRSGGAGGAPDGQFLEQFLRQRDEAAFEALVRRHGPMVWGVCRRLLGNPNDAEEAFQATFLVLVKRAGSIGRRELLANWLYGVARRTALKARTMRARRRQREKEVADMNDQIARDSGQAELRLALDEELSRLADRYRKPIVLCYLEGMTRQEAAQFLGWPIGTVAGRLSRALNLLRARMVRRDPSFVMPALGTALAENPATALPPALILSTTKAATLLAAGQTTAALSASVAALTNGVIKAMWMTKLKIALVLLVLATLCAGGGLIARQTLVSSRANAPNAKSADKPKTDKDRIQGTWVVVSGALKGEELPETTLAAVKFVFSGDKLTMTVTGVDIVANFKLDETQKPKHIDWSADAKRPDSIGIYEFAGDKLKLCMALPGKGRPSEFTTKGTASLWVLKREKKTDPVKKKEPKRLSLKEAEDAITSHIFATNPKMNRDAKFPLTEMTTDDVWTRLGVQVYQVKAPPQQGALFVIKKDQIYSIGPGGARGNSLKSVCVADLNGDKRPKLVYSFQFGSGDLCSRIAVFDCLAKEPEDIVAGDTYYNANDHLVLKRVNDQTVKVRTKSGNEVGKVVLEKKEGELKLKIEFAEDSKVKALFHSRG
jgi:RNA polymerase sigma-70 factor (ECF subfamily)